MAAAINMIRIVMCLELKLARPYWLSRGPHTIRRRPRAQPEEAQVEAESEEDARQVAEEEQAQQAAVDQEAAEVQQEGRVMHYVDDDESIGLAGLET